MLKDIGPVRGAALSRREKTPGSSAGQNQGSGSMKSSSSGSSNNGGGTRSIPWKERPKPFIPFSPV